MGMYYTRTMERIVVRAVSISARPITLPQHDALRDLMNTRTMLKHARATLTCISATVAY